ncbi:hypothetical protein Syun_001439 [Stephania yunnanensis]|uniref:O-fucosyltransferase family protein n=1 Tax=Stephania yunnanensis TaxID=152371 RepID=A0AAP0Q7R7_9MAGN
MTAKRPPRLRRLAVDRDDGGGGEYDGDGGGGGFSATMRCAHTTPRNYNYNSSKCAGDNEVQSKMEKSFHTGLRLGCFSTPPDYQGNKYKRGVNARNFEVEDLKAQASLVQDDDDENDLIHAWSMDMQLGLLCTVNPISNVYNFKVKAWSPIKFYKDKILPKLLEEKIAQFAWLARYCYMYFWMRFNCDQGLFSNLSLDMVAFSCCVYDGVKQEKDDMDATRERGWKGKFTRPGRKIQPGFLRTNGKCPLTPLEITLLLCLTIFPQAVGLMLRGTGFDNTTSIYLASGKIYNSEKNMIPLLEMFPLLQTKETLAIADELAPFKMMDNWVMGVEKNIVDYRFALQRTLVQMTTQMRMRLSQLTALPSPDDDPSAVATTIVETSKEDHK